MGEKFTPLPNKKLGATKLTTLNGTESFCAAKLLIIPHYCEEIHSNCKQLTLQTMFQHFVVFHSCWTQPKTSVWIAEAGGLEPRRGFETKLAHLWQLPADLCHHPGSPLVLKSVPQKVCYISEVLSFAIGYTKRNGLPTFYQKETGIKQ